MRDSAVDVVDGYELTERQRAVLDLMLELNSSKQIARILEISPSAVDQHIAAARKKLNASSRTELARQYLRLRAYSGISTCASTQVAVEPRPLQDAAQDQRVEPVFTLSDVAQFQMSPPWKETSVPPTGLEALDNRFGLGGRLGAIVVLATAIALLALAMMAMAETLSRLV